MAQRTVKWNCFSWNRRLAEYNKARQYKESIKLFQQVRQEGIIPDRFTFVRVINACAALRGLADGRNIHLQVSQSGLESDVYVGSSLVDMYAKCGNIEDAWAVFNKISTRNVVSWSALILGYVKCGRGQKALELFQQMQYEGVEPVPMTFVAVLNACASVGALKEGRRVHKQIIESSCELNSFVGSSLIDMYAKCGSIEDAWTVFEKLSKRDAVTWSTMILGYVKSGQGHKALELYQKMQQEGVDPVPATFVGVLNACASLVSLQEGKHVHKQIIQCGYESDVFVGSSLVDMYAKCGSIDNAWTVFKKISTRNAVSWSTMILGFVKCGQGQKALELFQLMHREGVEPLPVTFVGLLNACASLGGLDEGRYIHEQIIQSHCESNVYVGSSLIDMYAKCGSIEDAKRVFNKMPRRDAVAWSAMLGGYAMHGLSKEAIGHFERMCEECIETDGITFISLLSACSHAGLVDEGLYFFRCMHLVHNIPATVEHYVCIIDLLGRNGRLHEAEDLIKNMSCKQEASVWRALLGACRLHSNLERGEHIAQRIYKLDSGDAGGYVLLSNIYAASGKGDCPYQQQRLDRGLKIQTGHTWIEVNKVMHSFTVDDQEHPKIVEIHAELKSLSLLMDKDMYIPDTKLVMHDGEKEEVNSLHLHSEKLAIVFGLISTPPGTPLRIVKNLSVCSDCHTTLKFITEISKRTIIVRDANGFHYFDDGLCSCQDYWC